MKDNNRDNIKKALESQPVPQELEPDNIKKMLDEKAPLKKRSSIRKTALRAGAGAAACAVLCGVGLHFARPLKTDDLVKETQSSKESKSPESNGSEFIKSASDYEQLYTMLGTAYDKLSNDRVTGAFDNWDFKGTIQTNDDVTEEVMEEAAGSSEADSAAPNTGSTEHSDTYNQEEGVLEADIAKTDGEYIYYLCSRYDESSNEEKQLINIARAEDGSFTDTFVLDITEDFAVDAPDGNSTVLHDMYLYNDMLVVIGETVSYSFYGDDDYYCYDLAYSGSNSKTFVNLYTTGKDAELTDSYIQDGSYNDVRITPDGFMYLLTDYYSADYSNITDADDIEAYIPSYCKDGETCLIPAESIYLPEEDFGQCSSISYMITGSLDLNEKGCANETDIKAAAGFAGSVYCSADNLYTASGWDDTTVTRFSLDSGVITPAASGSVKGYVKDQFSMSEYNGYFRIATTNNNVENTLFNDIFNRPSADIKNYVYVLDMDLNKVGSISNFGDNETIKSVNFSGDLAYVVTYEQTDPLFAIDLSSPENPAILDEYKLPGYSTYMQQWSDGLLLGFGVNADENGIENGIKLVMFDNSDPANLREAGSVVLSSATETGWTYSEAVWERKALLIMPEKNIIGVPVERYDVSDIYYDRYSYCYYSYENGEFIQRGELFSEMNENYTGNMANDRFNRSVCIGNYVYALSPDCFISADISSFTEIEFADFTEAYNAPEPVEPEPTEPTEPESTEPVETEPETTETEPTETTEPETTEAETNPTETEPLVFQE